MIDGPGEGMKLNLLKKELRKHLNDEIILFTDSYDVIFLSDEKEIIKLHRFNCDLIFFLEKECWPDKDMFLKIMKDLINTLIVEDL